MAPTPDLGKAARPTGTAAAQSLNDNQHAGGGPDLTASGVGKAGAVTAADSPFAYPSNFQKNGATAAAVGKAGDGSLVIEQTFDKIIRWRNRLEPMYRQFAGVRAIRETAFPGTKVALFRTGVNGLNLATTPLSEYADPDAVRLPGLEESMDVTVDEYGNSTVVTQRVKRFSWQDINPMQIEYVGRNLRETVDAIYMNAIYSSTGGWGNKGARQAVVKAKTGTGTHSTIELTAGGYNDPMFDVTVGTGTRYGLLETGKLGGAAAGAAGDGMIDDYVIRQIVGHFRSLGVAPFADGLYNALITPDQSIALRETTNLAGWRYPHLEENANGNIWRGTTGVFEGVRFIEGPQFYGIEKGAGVPATTKNIINLRPATADTANVLFFGPEGIADVVVEEPHTVVTPTNDKFGRLFGLGWIGCLGATVYDPNAILLVSAKTR